MRDYYNSLDESLRLDFARDVQLRMQKNGWSKDSAELVAFEQEILQIDADQAKELLAVVFEENPVLGKSSQRDDAADEQLHIERSLGVMIEALWRALPAEKQNLGLASFNKARKYLSGQGGADTYIKELRSELAHFNERRNGKAADQGEVEKLVIDELQDLQGALIHLINERAPGRAGVIMLRTEIMARHHNDFLAVPGLTKGGWGAIKIIDEDAANVPALSDEVAKKLVAGQSSTTERLKLADELKSLSRLPENASAVDVQKVLNEHGQRRIDYEKMRHGGFITDQQRVKLDNGLLLEILKDSRGDYRLGLANVEIDRPTADILVAPKESGQIERVNIQSFEGYVLLDDRLGFGDQPVLSVQLANNEILQLRKDKKQWILESPPTGKRVVTEHLDEADVAKLRIVQGQGFAVAGRQTAEPVVYITLRYGPLSQKLMRDKSIKAALRSTMRPRDARTDSLEPQLVRQRLRNRPVLRWLKT